MKQTFYLLNIVMIFIYVIIGLLLGGLLFVGALSVGFHYNLEIIELVAASISGLWIAKKYRDREMIRYVSFSLAIGSIIYLALILIGTTTLLSIFNGITS